MGILVVAIVASLYHTVYLSNLERRLDGSFLRIIWPSICGGVLVAFLVYQLWFTVMEKSITKMILMLITATYFTCVLFLPSAIHQTGDLADSVAYVIGALAILVPVCSTMGYQFLSGKFKCP